MTDWTPILEELRAIHVQVDDMLARVIRIDRRSVLIERRLALMAASHALDRAERAALSATLDRIERKLGIT